MSVHQFLSREALFSPSECAVPLACGQEGKSILHKECAQPQRSLGAALPTKITPWTNASLRGTFCGSTWHAKQGEVLWEGSELLRNKEMAVRALVAGVSRAGPARADWLRPSKYKPPCKELDVVALRWLLKMAA